MPLALSVSFAPTMPDQSSHASPPDSVDVPFVTANAKGAKYNKSVTSTDSVFELDEITTIGYVRIRNRAEVPSVTTPDTPIVTEGGASAATTRTYKIVAVQADGTYSAASAAGTTTTGPATLNSTDFETLDWSAVPSTGALDHYDIYRTVAGGTPSTTGKIGSVAAGTMTFDDTGFAGDSATAPSVAADNVLLIGDTSGDYVLALKANEVATFRWNAAALHGKANTRTIPVDITILDA